MCSPDERSDIREESDPHIASLMRATRLGRWVASVHESHLSGKSVARFPAIAAGESAKTAQDRLREKTKFVSGFNAESAVQT
jgi:hypothetical protein